MQDYENYNGQDRQETEYSVKKPSPFADSPYVLQQPQYIPRQQKQTTFCRKERKPRKLLYAVLAMVLVLVTSLCTGAVMGMQQNQTAQDLAAAEEAISILEKKVESLLLGQGSDYLPEEDAQMDGTLSLSGVYASNVDAVVAISNQGLTTNIFGQVSRTASSGSGFIISADGYVVSNYHVVAGANTLKVITADGTEYPATLVGSDSSNDISVLKIDAQDLPYVKIGSSDALSVGERVAAIGNPLGELTSTLTVGYVSAKDRNVNTDGTAINMIQTDAAINSGNSGGPLFNMRGEVVGITTAKYSGTSGSGATIEGIGFAIPIDDVAGMIEDICENGYVSGAYLGVMVQDVSVEAVQLYGFPAGALVLEVTEGYCAKEAGIQAKDIIVDIGGNAVDSVSGLTKVLRKYEAGDTVEVTVYRSGAEEIFKLVLDERPVDVNDQTQQLPDQQIPDQQNPNSDGDVFGDWFGDFWPFGE
ncbi:MAG: trypsin-like peptidase domain-containing protein [Oscillospiraceae bacterium]|nr:trypsin-like peptidase domain-containing protein [Oscillospiraceae bacterium]